MTAECARLGGRSFARTTCEPQSCCPADFNGDGRISSQDIFDYLTAYTSADLRADTDHSGAVSFADLFDFLAAYFTPCE